MAAQAFEGWERAGNAADRWPTERVARAGWSALNPLLPLASVLRYASWQFLPAVLRRLGGTSGPVLAPV
jgi:hypothetical protein